MALYEIIHNKNIIQLQLHFNCSGLFVFSLHLLYLTRIQVIYQYSLYILLPGSKSWHTGVVDDVDVSIIPGGEQSDVES